MKSFFFRDQWIVLTASSPNRLLPKWNDFRPILPPLDRHWADPFILFRDGRWIMFMEEKVISVDRGRIIYLELDRQMKPQSSGVALERPYHLSYPFVFDFEGQLYMLPETKQNHAVELYRCIRFPDGWAFERTLIENVRAADATLLQSHGKWWMFANIEADGGSSWDSLCLFFADHPLSTRWTPHPQNPIVRDIHSARPAGRILLLDGMLVRPSQDCSVRYGYGINFNRITRLTETDYAEELTRTFTPPTAGPILATHTWNEAGSIVAIDAILHRKRI